MGDGEREPDDKSQRDPAGGGAGRGFDPIELMVRVAALFGASPVRVRWRLIAAQKRWTEAFHLGRQRAVHVGYAHRVCRSCGAVCDRSQRTCHACGDRLGSRAVEVLGRVGISVEAPGSGALVVGLVLVALYLRQMQACPGHGWATFPSACLVRAGGNVPYLSLGTEPWRLGTSVLLHIGLWHLGFNLVALAQVAPTVEQIFGRGRMLAWFVFTGVLGSLASALWRDAGVAAGASGALMGLIGVAAGWGHRDGTTLGRGYRDQMLKWAGYTMVFGFWMGADNAAHAGGLVVGLALGVWARPSLRLGSRATSLNVLAAIAGLAALAAFAVLVLLHARP